MHEQKKIAPSQTGVIALPSPTAWPMVLGMGVTLILGGLITHAAISLLGLLLAVMAIVGWFRNVLPHERHENVAVEIPALAEAIAPPSETPHTLHQEVDLFPSFSFIAGIESGIAGGFAMAIPAILFSLIKFHSYWYAINLMAAGGFVGWTNASDEFLSQFHLQGLLAAVAIHSLISVLMGLVYGAVVPIFPRRTLLTGGIMAPLLWTGLAYTSMNIVSPILSRRVDWLWFVLSQVAFGLVAGYVVGKRVKTTSEEFQALPLSRRAGLHGAQTRRRKNIQDK